MADAFILASAMEAGCGGVVTGDAQRYRVELEELRVVVLEPIVA